MKKLAGFTLIELMIVVAVVAILAAVAFPSYQEHVRKGNRVDAMTALTDLHVAQERWRSYNTQYAASLADLNRAATSESGLYTLAITAADAAGFTATATPAAGSRQAGDGCVFQINEAGPVIAGEADRRCWNR